MGALIMIITAIVLAAGTVVTTRPSGRLFQWWDRRMESARSAEVAVVWFFGAVLALATVVGGLGVLAAWLVDRFLPGV